MAISSVSFIQYPSSLTITTETNNSVLITKGYADGILGSVATEWSATTFTAGQIVSYNGKLYKAKNDTSASDIPGASNNWDEYDFTNILSDASTDITLSSGTPEYITVSGSTISLSGSKGVTSSGGNASDASKIVILGEDGKINSNMLPAIAITDTTVGDTAPSTKQEGDVWIDTTNSKSYIWDGSAWKELLSPVDGVVSINGNSGILTLGASDVGAIASSALVTEVKSTSTDATVPSALSVYSFVNGGYTAKGHTHTSANITDSVSAASGVTSTASGLAQAKAVYDYAAPKSHTHTSGNISDSISTSGGITSTETKLVQAKAVYSYIDGLALGTTYAAKSHTHTSANISDSVSEASGITGSASGLVQAKAVYSYIDGLSLGTTYAPYSHTHVSANITDSISTSGGITSSAAGLVQGKAVEAYAAKKSHNHTSADVTDAIAAGTGVTSTETKVTQAKAVYEYVASAISALDLANTYAAKSHTHVAADLPTATASAKGIASFGSGLTVSSGAVTLSAATADALGGVKVGAGNGLAYSSNKITMSLANGTSAGTVKASTGITISSGNISVNFSTDISTDASSDVKAATPKAVKTYVDTAITGLVGSNHTHTLDKIIYDTTNNTGYTAGTTISDASTDGQLATALAVYTYAAPVSHSHTAADLPTATASAKGIASFGTGLTVSSGAVTLSAATADALGGVKVGTGNGLTYSSNKITMATANGTTAGACKQGTGVTVSSAGAISVNFSTDISTDATSDVKAATPKAVKTYADSAASTASSNAIKYSDGTTTVLPVKFYYKSETIASPGVTTKAFTHNLGTAKLMVQVLKDGAPVLCDWTATTTTITLSFAVATYGTLDVMIVAFPTA